MSTPPLLRHETILGRYDEYPPGSEERAKSLGLKLWSETKCLVAWLRLVRGTAGTIDREEAWRSLGVASQAELVEEILGHVAESEDVPVAELVTTILSRLSPAVASDAAEEPTAGSGSRVANLRHEPLGDADAVTELTAAKAILGELRAAGVAVEAREGNLRLSPASRVDAALLARVKASKPVILCLLATRPDPAELWRRVIEDVAEKLKLPPDVLEAARHARVKWR